MEQFDEAQAELQSSDQIEIESKLNEKSSLFKANGSLRPRAERAQISRLRSVSTFVQRMRASTPDAKTIPDVVAPVDFKLQSTDTPAMSMGATNTTTQNMEFTDGVVGETKDYVPVIDKTFTSSHNIQTELGEYLSRPVLIYGDTWTENNDLNQTIQPWTLFFSDERIKGK